MKHTLLLTALPFLLTFTTFTPSMPSSSDNTAAIRATITQFAQGADNQDVAALAESLHPEAQQFFLSPDGLVRLTVPAYLGMVEAKQIGGVPRDITIASIDVTAHIAQAKATFANDAMRLDNYVSLMQVDGEWKILSIVIKLEMRGK